MSEVFPVDTLHRKQYAGGQEGGECNDLKMQYMGVKLLWNSYNFVNDC